MTNERPYSTHPAETLAKARASGKPDKAAVRRGAARLGRHVFRRQR